MRTYLAALALVACFAGLVSAQCPASFDVAASASFDAQRVRFTPNETEGTEPIVPPANDCELRQLAFHYGAAVLPEWIQTTTAAATINALNLTAPDCPPPSLETQQAGRMADSTSSSRLQAPSATFWVDSLVGNDANPGTMAQPWKTLARCVQYLNTVAPAQRPDGVAFKLNPGTFALEEPVTITPAMAYGMQSSAKVSFEAPTAPTGVGDEWPTVSGAAQFPPGALSWTPSSKPNPDGSVTMTATLPSSLMEDLAAVFPAPLSLRVNGSRFWPARWPNGNPEGYCNPFNMPAGGCPDFAKATGSGNPARKASSSITLPVNTQLVATLPEGTPTIVASGTTYPLTTDVRNISVDVGSATHWATRKATCTGFSAHTGGDLDRYDQTFATPFWDTTAPSSMGCSNLSSHDLSVTEGVHVHAFHPAGWGGWMFNISSADSAGNLQFDAGGFQEARGGGISHGQDFYISNSAPELDAQNEFYIDMKQGTLSIAINPGSQIDSTFVEVPVLRELFRIVGSDGTPAGAASNGFVGGVELNGLALSGTLPTFMSAYEQPSGGDWAIHRGGALFVSNATGIRVENCLFDHVEGNAIFLSQRVQDSVISQNVIVGAGESAIALQGSCLLMDCTDSMFVTRNNITANLFRNWGVWGKQTAAVYVSISRDNYVAGNVMYTGPRAGFNVNDGIGGGNVFEGNLGFGVVLQSSDHGTLNSWGRRPAFWPVVDPIPPSTSASAAGEAGAVAAGAVTYVPGQLVMRSNFFFRSSYYYNSNSIYALDNDDGSSNWLHTGNVVVRGPVKFRDGLDKHATDNLFFYPDYSERYAAAFQVNGFDTEVFTGNTLVTTTGVAYGFCAGFSASGHDVPAISNNSFVLDGPGVVWNNGGCGGNYDFEAWQKLGLDVGSTVVPANITTTDVSTMVCNKLAVLPSSIVHAKWC